MDKYPDCIRDAGFAKLSEQIHRTHRLREVIWNSPIRDEYPGCSPEQQDEHAILWHYVKNEVLRKLTATFSNA